MAYRCFSSVSLVSIRRLSATNSSMAMAAVFHRISKGQNCTSLCTITNRRFNSISCPINTKPFKNPFQVRSLAAISEAAAGFDEMVSSTQRKYYMLGGKEVLGKQVVLHPLLYLTVYHDLSGGTLVPVEGLDSPLFALEINPEISREEFRTASQKSGGSGVKDFMDSMGLGMLADQHVFQVLLLHSVLEPFSCTSINNEVYFLDQAYIHSG
ncbi:hypothetical protein CK203_025881 [Vitis vinifera]|uniref:Uncharacterized protein n=1 Tax=Vitis vinifera TaxID=29760 RepID=A0A438IKP9_VITVI|nr:hypothetical protein CK203_025881 [Vitis vinifera]